MKKRLAVCANARLNLFGNPTWESWNHRITKPTTKGTTSERSRCNQSTRCSIHVNEEQHRQDQSGVESSSARVGRHSGYAGARLKWSGSHRTNINPSWVDACGGQPRGNAGVVERGGASITWDEFMRTKLLPGSPKHRATEQSARKRASIFWNAEKES